MVIARATMIAVAAAVAWAISPLTVTSLVLLWLMCRRSVRDLNGDERRWVTGALTLAIIARLAALVAVFLLSDPERESFHAIIPDARFAIQRSLMLLTFWRGEPIGPFYLLRVFDPYAGHAFNETLAAVQWFSGPSPYALVLISVCAFIAAALLLFVLARPRLGRGAAVAGLIVVLFWPTWFIWSVSMLKESSVLLLCAVGLWGGVKMLDRTRTWPLHFTAAAASVTTLLVLRDGVAAIPAVGIIVGSVAAFSMRRSTTALGCAAACAIAITVAASRPSAQAFVGQQVRAAASRHIGHVLSRGSGYKVADDRFYANWPDAPWTMQFGEGVRFLARAAVAFVAVPLPWQLPSAASLVFLPEQFAWYGLIGLACGGVWWGIRRSPRLTLVLAACVLAGVAVIAPNSGNIGTLVRHRDMVVPFLAWLSTAGAVQLMRG